jgi:hypothetical protein
MKPITGIAGCCREAARRCAAEKRDERGASCRTQGLAPPPYANAGHQKAMALCGRFAAHLAHHGGDGQVLGQNQPTTVIEPFQQHPDQTSGRLKTRKFTDDVRASRR